MNESPQVEATEHKNIEVQCPVCGAQLSLEPAEEAQAEHAMEEQGEAAGGPSIRDALKGAMGG